MPETSGRAGALGFCMGGRIAYKLAVASDPDVVVSYYGSGIGAGLDSAGEVHCPILFHFGDSDQYLPLEESSRIRDAFAARADAEVQMHAGAGHAFDNPSPIFHHLAASQEAWPQTAAFLRRYLPPDS
jgi:carboxymethylenebutenolidase